MGSPCFCRGEGRSPPRPPREHHVPSQHNASALCAPETCQHGHTNAKYGHDAAKTDRRRSKEPTKILRQRIMSSKTGDSTQEKVLPNYLHSVQITEVLLGLAEEPRLVFSRQTSVEYSDEGTGVVDTWRLRSFRAASVRAMITQPDVAISSLWTIILSTR